jgi:hypothetical protein
MRSLYLYEESRASGKKECSAPILHPLNTKLGIVCQTLKIFQHTRRSKLILYQENRVDWKWRVATDATIIVNIASASILELIIFLLRYSLSNPQISTWRSISFLKNCTSCRKTRLQKHDHPEFASRGCEDYLQTLQILDATMVMVEYQQEVYRIERGVYRH